MLENPCYKCYFWEQVSKVWKWKATALFILHVWEFHAREKEETVAKHFKDPGLERWKSEFWSRFRHGSPLWATQSVSSSGKRQWQTTLENVVQKTLWTNCQKSIVTQSSLLILACCDNCNYIIAKRDNIYFSHT